MQLVNCASHGATGICGEKVDAEIIVIPRIHGAFECPFDRSPKNYGCLICSIGMNLKCPLGQGKSILIILEHAEAKKTEE